MKCLDPTCSHHTASEDVFCFFDLGTKSFKLGRKLRDSHNIKSMNIQRRLRFSYLAPFSKRVMFEKVFVCNIFQSQHKYILFSRCIALKFRDGCFFGWKLNGYEYINIWKGAPHFNFTLVSFYQLLHPLSRTTIIWFTSQWRNACA